MGMTLSTNIPETHADGDVWLAEMIRISEILGQAIRKRWLSTQIRMGNLLTVLGDSANTSQPHFH